MRIREYSITISQCFLHLYKENNLTITVMTQRVIIISSYGELKETTIKKKMDFPYVLPPPSP